MLSAQAVDSGGRDVVRRYRDECFFNRQRFGVSVGTDMEWQKRRSHAHDQYADHRSGDTGASVSDHTRQILASTRKWWFWSIRRRWRRRAWNDIQVMEILLLDKGIYSQYGDSNALLKDRWYNTIFLEFKVVKKAVTFSKIFMFATGMWWLCAC